MEFYLIPIQTFNELTLLKSNESILNSTTKAKEKAAQKFSP